MNFNLKYLATNLINIFFTVVELILGLRFILKLFGANANNDFVGWIYDMSSTLLDPFRGIFPNRVFEHQYVLELTTIFAMLVYAIIGMLLIWVVGAISPEETVTKKSRK